MGKGQLEFTSVSALFLIYNKQDGPGVKVQQLLIVFLGGGLGSCSRYLISKFMSDRLRESFPFGTFTVNILGCFLIGIILEIVVKYNLHPLYALLLATGFCGGFTTFSTFALENVLYVRETNYIAAFSYTFISIIWGFSATFLGFFITKRL